LRARSEQTQSEDLSDASFLGKLLVLPANVRLDWNVIARHKHSSLFGLVYCNKEKKFYNIDTRRRAAEASAGPEVSLQRQLVGPDGRCRRRRRHAGSGGAPVPAGEG
jgi:hypothetical protein